MNDSSNRDSKRSGLRPKRPSELRSQSLRGSRPSIPVTGSASRPTSRARPAGSTPPTGSHRSKPVSRVRLKALRTTPEGGVAPVIPDSEALPAKADTAATPVPRMPTQSDADNFQQFNDDVDQDATLAQLSGDLLQEVKRQQFEEGILGASQIPEYEEAEDNSDKTVV